MQCPVNGRECLGMNTFKYLDHGDVSVSMTAERAKEYCETGADIYALQLTLAEEGTIVPHAGCNMAHYALDRLLTEDSIHAS